ncbi:MAG TPA: helix-turn-helix transcriptional regulator, partial [Gemmataceae bacterium]|nr:helix-turn-helix transcriptional regulator [Gemmataceae bacterium]
RLRLSKVRAVFRLVGECRELGADNAAWCGHLAEHVGGLLGSQVSMVGELVAPADGVTPARTLSAFQAGWPSGQPPTYVATHPAWHEPHKEPVLCAMQGLLSRKGVCSRDQAVEDRVWFPSTFFNDVLRPCHLAEMLVSFCDLPGGRRQTGISLFREARGGVFRRRERRLVRLLHEEIGRHCGTALATLDDPGPSALTPRVRATLRCLLEGDSEKQVAARLGVSILTVHDYVKALYAHFGVASRPELLAYFLRRSGLRLPEPDDPA